MRIKPTMKYFLALFFVLCFLFLPKYQAIANPDIDSYEIKIPFVVGESVTASYNGQQYTIGEVVALPTKTRWPSYTASAWGVPGEICASAVNAIHMLVSVEKDKGRTMSIIPKETIAPAAGAGASIVLSTKAGYGIFGSWSPTVGSQVFIQKQGSSLKELLNIDNLPKSGDALVIYVQNLQLPYMAEIENHPGGRVTIWDKDGYNVIGRVIKPVGGTGRFEGTLFQRTSALRANHSGVIDYSTSPYGKIGGFQIIPWEHAISSKEMQGAWDMTQWLIIGPKDGISKIGSTFPLFKQGLVTGPSNGETLWDVWSTYGKKSLFLVRINGGPWQKIFDITGKNDTALSAVTHLRLYFPFHREIQESPNKCQ
ncbi:MAG: hypothetical protein GXZ18_00655 [Synergistaceae bacterium]|nr:hypothetical protein [Synergistaceae bacterium]